MLYNFSKRAEKVSMRVDKTFNQEKDSLRYLFITSCIRKFIPGIDDEKMAYLIRNILTNQAKHVYGSHCLSLLLYSARFIFHHTGWDYSNYCH